MPVTAGPKHQSFLQSHIAAYQKYKQHFIVLITLLVIKLK